MAAAYGIALALLPFWIPVPARRYDAVAVAHCLALAVWSTLEDFALRRLLRETETRRR